LGVLGFINVYFEYIKTLCKMFVKYIIHVLKVYPTHLIIYLKIITNDFVLILYYIFISVTCIKKFIILLLKSFQMTNALIKNSNLFIKLKKITIALTSDVIIYNNSNNK